MESKARYSRAGAPANYQIYNDEDIAKANAVSIPDLARSKGYNVKDVNQRWAEVKGQGGLSIDKAGNRWYCHSTRKGGGPIQLVMYLDGSSWQDAMSELLNGESSYLILCIMNVMNSMNNGEGFSNQKAFEDYKNILLKVYPYITRDITKDEKEAATDYS